MSYTLRTTSLVGTHLDTELATRGARTSGSTPRKQQRLQRFRDAEARLRNTIEDAPAPAPVRRPSPAPIHMTTRSIYNGDQRIRNIIASYLG